MSILPRKAAAAVVPRPAATTLIVRDAAAGFEVLMVRRSLQASFMPGAYVFPGGAVDAADGSPEHAAQSDEAVELLTRRVGAVAQVGAQALAYCVGALRECFEECGLWLGAIDAGTDWNALRVRLHAGESFAALAAGAGVALATSALQPWSHWVTPAGIPKRFDTLFFVARAPQGQLPEVDAGETTTLAWIDPRAALAAHARREFPMEFATVSTVQSLLPLAHRPVQALLAHAAAQTSLPALQPRLQLDGAAATEASGVLRLSSTPAFARRRLAPLMPDFLRANPALRVEFVLAATPPDLFEQQIDVSFQSGNIPDSTLVARRVTVARWRLCAAPSYLQRAGTPRTPAELAQHQCLNFLPGSYRSRWLTRRDGKIDTFEPKATLAANNGDLLCALAVAGMGIARLADYHIDPELASGQLVTLLDDHELDREPIYAVYPSKRHLSVRVRVFLDFIGERMAQG